MVLRIGNLGFQGDSIEWFEINWVVSNVPHAAARAAQVKSALNTAARADGAYRAFLWESRRVAGEPATFITGKDVTDRRKLEVTQSLKIYELYAEAARVKKASESKV